MPVPPAFSGAARSVEHLNIVQLADDALRRAGESASIAMLAGRPSLKARE